MTERRKSILVVSVVVALMLVASEVFLRFAFPQPTYSALRLQFGSYYAPSDYHTFQLKKNYVGFEPSMQYPGRMVRVTTNSDGFRGPELDKAKSRIVVMGDSYTFGVFVEDHETYPAVLDRLVNERSPGYQVVNAAYANGYDTDQQYVWLRHNLGALNPKIVVLGVFLGNDINNIDPSSWVDVDAEGLPRKWIAKHLVVNEDGNVEDKSEDPRSTVVDTAYRVPLFRDSHLFILVGKVFDRIKNRITGARGYTEYRFQHVFGDYSEDFLSKERLFLKLVGAMNALCERNGTKFLVALLPVNFMVEREKIEKVIPRSKYRDSESVYYARLADQLGRLGIPTLDIEREMKASREGPFFPANGEVHFNDRGNAFTARKLRDFMVARGYLQ